MMMSGLLPPRLSRTSLCLPPYLLLLCVSDRCDRCDLLVGLEASVSVARTPDTRCST